MTATAPGSQLHTPEAKRKSAITRVKKLKETMSEAEFQAMLRDELGLEPAAETEAITYAGDADAVAVLKEPTDEERDYPALLAGLAEQEKVVADLWNRASSDSERQAHARRLNSLRFMRRITEAAKVLKRETRTFGCRKSPTMKVSGRNTGFPEIRFHYHTYTTDDPLLTARLLDYMENPLPGDPKIEILRPGYVALVASASGQFAQWIEGLQADEVIATSRGMFRRPNR